MRFKIRRLTLKDLPQLLSLFNTSLEEDFEEFQPTVAKVYRRMFNKKYFVAFMKKRKNCVLGIFHKGKLVGLFMMYGHSGGVLEYIWLIVDKDFRRKGIASSLITKAEEWALRHKFHHTYLYTMNKRLVEFYKSLGFEHVGWLRNFFFGVGEHLMQKILREEPFEEIFEKYLKKK
ncbi:GNAT family N-acetyltransferase [Candidatus Roizmanbacteria bacterium]|nr:GNAT family N-acetyltransferase [Candidatus Roizmanbacteria bacterium]